ncbi:MAG TPA: Vps62-related protein [Caulobacter sp.]|nr:Vps62-related protein [Caulobacter sp.]
MSGIVFQLKAADACVWADHGSGAGMDGSFWRPSVIDEGYFLLGDVAQAGYDQPQTPATLVRAIEDGHGLPPLAPPLSLTLFWNNLDGANWSFKGDAPVSFWQLNPPPFYRALGVVLTGNGVWPGALTDTPPLTLFRCVREDLLVQAGVTGPIWTDQESGIFIDVRCDQIQSDTALVSGSFVVSHDYDNPAPGPYWALNAPPAKVGEQGVIQGVM